MPDVKAPNGYGTCQNCKYLDKRDANSLTGCAGTCHRGPPKPVETADPAVMMILGTPGVMPPESPQLVPPLVPAIVVSPEGTVKRMGFGRVWPPVRASDYCGEFSAGRPRE